MLHREHRILADDPLWRQAAATLVAAVFDAPDVPEPHADVLEKLFLLHTGGFYRLSEDRFERVVEGLVTVHAGRPDAAVGYARFCPGNARCAAVLERYAAPDVVTPPRTPGELDVTVTAPLGATDATTSLFKSPQEVDFFLAVREVFPTYLVYPNVALSCLIDYERIKDRLSPEARPFFFRGVVDCVVFDQHDGYRPCYFFELDSAFHDDPVQQARDRHKDHILALAGQTLHRIRKRDPASGRAAFVELLLGLREERATGDGPLANGGLGGKGSGTSL